MGTTYPTNKPLNDIIAVAYAPWLPPPLLINAAALKNDSITQLRRHTAVSLQWRLMLWPRSALVPNRSIDVSASCLWLLSEILTPGDKFPPRTRSVYKYTSWLACHASASAYLIAPRYTDMYVIGNCHLILIAIRSQRANSWATWNNVNRVFVSYY